MLVVLRMKGRVVMRMVRVMDGEYDDEGSGEGGDEGDGEDGGMVKD